MYMYLQYFISPLFKKVQAEMELVVLSQNTHNNVTTLMHTNI